MDNNMVETRGGGVRPAGKPLLRGIHHLALNTSTCG